MPDLSDFLTPGGEISMMELLIEFDDLYAVVKIEQSIDASAAKFD